MHFDPRIEQLIQAVARLEEKVRRLEHKIGDVDDDRRRRERDDWYRR